MGLGQPTQSCQSEQQSEAGKHREDRAPARSFEHQGAEDGRDGRGDAEEKAHGGHRPLGARTGEAITHHRPADDDPGTGHGTHQQTAEQKHFEAGRQRTHEGEERVKQGAREDHPRRPAASESGPCSSAIVE